MDIVYFGNAWDAENRTSSHHIADRLGRRYRLLYVDTPGLRAPSASARDLRRMVRKVAQIAEPPTRIGDSMWRLTMPQIPLRRLPFVPALNRSLGPALVRRALRRLGFHRPLLWFVVPHALTVLGKLGEAAKVYYCIDNYSTLPGVDAEAVQRMDDFLTREADLLYCCSPVLYEKKRQINPHTHFSPHGVDAGLFGQALDPSLPVAEGARHLKHPVIGYFGVFRGDVDMDLLVRIAKERPHYTLLLIGAAHSGFGELAHLPNVVITGPVPYRTLPSWAKAFDVGIMPYLQTGTTLNSNPLKLREYLAAGLPVVSIWLPEVERFAQHVEIAHNRDEFLPAIDRALATDSPAARQARAEAVRPLTWDARVDEVIRILEARFPSMAPKSAG